MKIYTQFELQQMPSYDILKNILNEGELQHYYNTPLGERGNLANKTIVRKPRGQFKQPIPIFTPTPTPQPIFTPTPTRIYRTQPQPTVNVNTQMCTSLYNRVGTMAQEYMTQDFTYRGQVYNMTDLGWQFSFNTNRNRFGVCRKRLQRKYSSELMRFEYFMVHKKIELSRWLIQNSEKTFEEWVNTMKHEIAHAIDSERNSDCRSSHGYKWIAIARAIGCSAERCSDAKVDATKSKYTIVCDSCGKREASHKKSRVISQGRRACGKCCKTKNGGRFTKDYLLKQIQNY